MQRFRSAITGRWVTKLFARKNPATTVSETAGTATTGATVTLTGHWSQPWDTGTFSVSSDLAPCPYCRKDIPVGSVLCGYCQSEIGGDR